MEGEDRGSISLTVVLPAEPQTPMTGRGTLPPDTGHAAQGQRRVADEKDRHAEIQRGAGHHGPGAVVHGLPGELVAVELLADDAEKESPGCTARLSMLTLEITRS
jgi:hypothetical protein